MGDCLFCVLMFTFVMHCYEIIVFLPLPSSIPDKR